MKRIALMIMLAASVIAANAQTESEHLTFQGIPIDGKTNQFVKKLKKQGYKLAGKGDSATALTGQFAGYDNCRIFVNNGNPISIVAVQKSCYYTWKSLKIKYDDIKSQLTLKYGEPTICTEEFPSYATSDYMKLQCIKSGEYKYQTIYNTPKGVILITFNYYSKSDKYFVTIVYKDRINGK